MEKAISSQDLAPHTPEEGGFAFFFYDLAWHQACHLCDLAINAWLFAVVVGCGLLFKMELSAIGGLPCLMSFPTTRPQQPRWGH